MSVLTALEESLGELDLESVDSAVVALARSYATAIDEGDDDPLVSYGPKLLSCLEHLLLTPKARKAVTKENAQDVDSPLDELRAKRAARARA